MITPNHRVPCLWSTYFVSSNMWQNRQVESTLVVLEKIVLHYHPTWPHSEHVSCVYHSEVCTTPITCNLEWKHCGTIIFELHRAIGDGLWLIDYLFFCFVVDCYMDKHIFIFLKIKIIYSVDTTLSYTFSSLDVKKKMWNKTNYYLKEAFECKAFAPLILSPPTFLSCMLTPLCFSPLHARACWKRAEDGGTSSL